MLPSIYFDYKQARLQGTELSKLKRILAIMQDNSDKTFVLSGWTDGIGPKKYNINLGQCRANTVKKWLVEHGADPSQLEVVGKGKSFTYDNTTIAGRVENRRVDISIY